MKRLFQELKRRNVYKVAMTYAAVAFVTLQAARLIFPATTLEGAYDVLVLVAFVGFPIALVIAWAFELTPEGVRRTPDAEGTEAEEAPAEERRSESGLALKALVGLGLVAAAVAGSWYLMGGGGEPSAETAATTDTASTKPRAGNRSIAVLPFENMGGEESEQFTRGIHDGLLTRLANVTDLKVISRTSVMQFEETELPLPVIADSLGVKWVMEGGVQRMGEQIQVNAQLIDPRTDTHAWADRYRRDLTASDFFAIQTEITKRIARSLEAQLTRNEQQRVERQPTGDLEAYRLYVRGRNLLGQRTEESIREATLRFEEALRRDSTYALAWAGLADARLLDAIYGPPPLEERRALVRAAREAARRARSLDPDLAEARTALGAIHVYANREGLASGKGAVALEELRRAVGLKPSYANAQQWLAELYLRLGRPEPALEHASLAVELNPEHAAARQVLIWALIANDRGDETWSHFQQYPRSNLRLRILSLYHSGRWDELEALAQKQLRDETRGPWRFFLARIGAVQGDTAAAREHLARFRKDEAFVGVGLVHAALGEPEGAFSAWAEVEEWRGPGDLLLRYWFPDILDPLREDPRYRELIRAVNREWGLNPDGSLPDSLDVSFGSRGDAND